MTPKEATLGRRIIHLGNLSYSPTMMYGVWQVVLSEH
jgi:hypothetical protein